MSLTYLSIEIRRALRNRRALIFSILMPGLLLVIFGEEYKGQDLNGAAVIAYLMVTMGLFGSMNAAISSGGTIAVERGLGWNRQLRLTPLSPARYALTKVVLSLLLALPPLLVTYVIGIIEGARLPAHTWLAVFAISWVGAIPFAALGVLLGYLVKPDSVQPVSGLLFMLLAVTGGIFIPAEQMPDIIRRVAEWTPAYWVGQSARAPLFDHGIALHGVWMVAAWTLVFAVAALRRFRSDTARA